MSDGAISTLRFCFALITHLCVCGFPAVINEDINLELLEVLELYSEILIARFGMLDQKYVIVDIPRVYNYFADA